jgi:hypothetical protein
MCRATIAYGETEAIVASGNKIAGVVMIDFRCLIITKMLLVGRCSVTVRFDHPSGED